jgi:hypothetical protein
MSEEYAQKLIAGMAVEVAALRAQGPYARLEHVRGMPPAKCFLAWRAKT